MHAIALFCISSRVVMSHVTPRCCVRTKGKKIIFFFSTRPEQRIFCKCRKKGGLKIDEAFFLQQAREKTRNKKGG
ncbi:hypothetical protein GGI42DRAFT_196377 [Trichoderma sp. SZMC 28013]